MNERAERYRDFFDLQLRFAEAIAETKSMPIAEAVLLYTNFHRRFGLGDVTRDGLNPQWREYAHGLSRLGTHEQRAGWTQQFYTQAPEERPAFPDHVFGCFDFHASDDSGIVRLHFYNRDTLGSLSRGRTGERQRELANMFASIRQRFPDARHVEGRSWLYGIEAYRRLFPEEYVRSRVVMEHDRRFQGMARWGQFLDRRGNVKPALKETFLHNIGRLDATRLWEVFPLPSFRVSAPIDAFYVRYEIQI
ncbi:hypothetical protein [Bradyrhizobium valentinum]|uniref:Uncharacterized protein n=1 Tax=Bradyrhizobium valentinum TaxID=1518501 RepID=A0A0R3LUP4_9BRAD|nr:hypothetical protein [Bradyrhizobium valentinum]KRR11690.1 hypothetical protein CP49_30660 [Bradyrhizobium valentinum]